MHTYIHTYIYYRFLTLRATRRGCECTWCISLMARLPHVLPRQSSRCPRGSRLRPARTILRSTLVLY